MTLASLPLIITGIWALVRYHALSSTLSNSVIIQGPVHHYVVPIATLPSISVVIISVLVIIKGVLMIAVLVGFGLCVKYERASTLHNELPYHLMLKAGVEYLIIANL